MSPNLDTGIDENVFYERLVVLSTLHSLDRERYHRIERFRDPNPLLGSLASASTQTESRDLKNEHKLRVFLDYLAEVCASTRSGRTVTAVTIHLPKKSNRPEYLFVSNNRFRRKISDQCSEHIEGTLKAFEGFRDDHGSPRHREISPADRDALSNAVKFNQERFKAYVRIILNSLNTLFQRWDLDQSCKHIFTVRPEQGTKYIAMAAIS